MQAVELVLSFLMSATLDWGGGVYLQCRLIWCGLNLIVKLKRIEFYWLVVLKTLNTLLSSSQKHSAFMLRPMYWYLTLFFFLFLRIFSKFHVRRMQELTDTGLHNFFCLFLSLAITADTEDIVSSFVDAKSSWNLKIKS